jgi:hypothetical protein
VLNRLFIIVGLIAILALGAAFVVPGFIRWEDYRDRMEATASQTLGAPVQITGEIKFALLPEPQLRFTKVVVGAADRQVMTVEQVEARFSLVDFFRDRYTLTKLELVQPVIDLRVDAAGKLEGGVTLADSVTQSGVSVASAQISDGSVRLADARTGTTNEVTAVAGELRIESVGGPYNFQGTGAYAGGSYGLRLGSSAALPDGSIPVSLFVQADDQRFSLAAEGQLTTGDAPNFAGTMTYRQMPAKPAADQPVDAGKGAMVIASKVEANAERVLLSDYTVTPDENRAATRLLGAAEIKLGASPSFNAVISGTALALPPRDATVETAVSPYELVRLLAELAVPPVPDLPGTIGFDITEIDLRAVTLRNVRLDAEASGGAWEIKSFSAQLPGNGTVQLAGALKTVAGRPNFAGTLSLVSGRVDALAQLWRKPSEGNPLLGVEGSLAAKVALVGQTLSLSDGALVLDGAEHAVSAEIGFGATSRHLNLKGQFAAMTPRQSAALGALLPELSDGGAFALTFPKGAFDIKLPSATVFDLTATNFAAVGSWEGGVVVVDRLAADDLGGSSFEARLTAFGSFERPELSGTGTLQMLSANAPALTRLYDLTGASDGLREFLSRSLPAELTLTLDAPSGEGGQAFTVSGEAASTAVQFDARVSAGFLRALSGPLSFNLDLKSDDAAALTAQLGLGDLSLTPDGEPMHAVAIVEGTPANSLEVTLRVDGGTDSIGFAGNVVVNDPTRLTGNGTVKATLGDLTALTASLGAGGIDVPTVTGSAHVEFIGTSSLLLDQINATSGGEQFSGSLSLSEVAGKRTVSGALTVGRFDPVGLFTVLVGRQAMLASGGVWPDGPFATGYEPRTTTGRVSITTPALVADGRDVITDARFDLDWDETTTRIRQFAGTVGGGQITLDASICCAGPLPDKQVTGRVTLAGVEIDALAPTALGAVLGGKLDGSAQFDGTGGDLQALLAGMTGQGSYSVTGLKVERLDAGVFASAAGLQNVLEEDALVLSAALVDTLDDASFAAETVNGSFTIAGGTLRSPNLAIAGAGAKLFGSLSLGLDDLVLGGGFVMTPTAAAAPESLVSEATAQIGIRLGGTLLAPAASFDVGSMIDAMKAAALEVEVARLEKLRAEDEARRKAAAEEQARIAAEEAKQQALEEAARKAAADAAARQKAEEEAAARAERQRQLQQQPSPFDLGIN